jgi:hypothetical protein
MLQNLSPDVRDCLRRAEDCAVRAKRKTNLELQREFFEMEMLGSNSQAGDQARPAAADSGDRQWRFDL